jgi:hypothetical protein
MFLDNDNDDDNNEPRKSLPLSAPEKLLKTHTLLSKTFWVLRIEWIKSIKNKYLSLLYYQFSFFFFFQYWGLNSRPHAHVLI